MQGRPAVEQTGRCRADRRLSRLGGAGQTGRCRAERWLSGLGMRRQVRLHTQNGMNGPGKRQNTKMGNQGPADITPCLHVQTQSE